MPYKRGSLDVLYKSVPNLPLVPERKPEPTTHIEDILFDQLTGQ